MPAALRYAFQSSASSSSSALRSVELHQFDHCTKCATGRRQGTDDTELLALEVLKQDRGEALRGFGRTSGPKPPACTCQQYDMVLLAMNPACWSTYFTLSARSLLHPPSWVAESWPYQPVSLGRMHKDNATDNQRCRHLRNRLCT